MGRNREFIQKKLRRRALFFFFKFQGILNNILEFIQWFQQGHFKHTGIDVILRRKYFDCDAYLDQNSDVKAEGVDPLQHFLIFGLDEGREGRFFDHHWYLRRYPDVKALGIDAYVHFQRYGKGERRDARHIVIRQDPGCKRRTHYEDWLLEHNRQLQISAEFRHAKLSAHAFSPKISIILPVFNPPLAFLELAIQSVLKQSYNNWELCIADDASQGEDVGRLLRHYAESDPRIKLTFRKQNGHISAASNTALRLADGDFIALFDHDDLLSEDALFWVVDMLNNHPDADIIYSDEDKIDETGRRFDPYFKSDFNYELFLAQNMISHLGVYRHALVKAVGGFRLGFEGSQDHDLALRVFERSEVGRVRHIPRVLYHWRAILGSTALDVGEKSYAAAAGVRAVEEHLERLKVRASVTVPYPKIGQYRVRYALPEKPALVSIIIPTRDQADVLKTCIESIWEKTTYADYEIIVIDNGSEELATHGYFKILGERGVQIVRDESLFNYSYLNNKGVKRAKGKYVVLMNNDIEVITKDWLEEMLSFGQRPDIGCVGARLWYPNKTVQHAGVILGLGGVAGHAHKHFSADSMGYFCRAAHHQSFSAVTAACLLVRRSVFLEVGGLDENLAVAFNDVDFCLRVRNAGYRNVWTPYAELFHHESLSRGEENTLEKQARFQREIEYMRVRWGDELFTDPAYNPNLALEHTDFSYAWPPRLSF